MNDKLFEQMMSAVDDDLLEEAQLPMNKQRTTKSKRAWAILAAGAAACIALVAATTLHTPLKPWDTASRSRQMPRKHHIF